MHWRRERQIHAAGREKRTEDQRKTKAEETRKPSERILARIETEKKEETIKRTEHRRPPVREKKSQTKGRTAQATQQKFESRLLENHLE